MSRRPRYVRIAGVNLSQVPMDYIGNELRILEALREAERQRASVVVFGELDVSGYNCERGFQFPWVAKNAMKTLEKVVTSSSGSEQVIVLGMPLLYERRLLNTVAVVANGTLLGFYTKQFLARGGRHYEPKWFKSWPAGKVGYVEFEGKRVPVGHLMFEISGVKIGAIICQDAWERDNPSIPFARAGMDILTISNASHFSLGKVRTRESFVTEISRSHNCAVAYVNKLGNEGGAEVYDGDFWLYQCGVLKGAAQRLTFKQVQVTTSTVDLDLGVGQAISDPSDAIQPGEEIFTVGFDEFTWPDQRYEPPNIDLAPWETSPNLEQEELCRAIALGSLDYLRKSGTAREVVCLSGGADSTAIIVNRHDSIRLLLKEQGFAGFARLFGHLEWVRELAATHPAFLKTADELKDFPDEAEDGFREIMAKMVRAIYLPGEHSSRETEESAAELARATGITFSVRPFGKIFSAILDFVVGEIGRVPDWATDNVSLQNISARIRGLLGWTLANFLQGLLIPPSNMSELMVGYWTEGGDNAGGADWVGGVEKSRLLKYLKVRHERGLVDLPPLDVLRYVLALQPSAELAPAANGKKQSDEGDLGPYEIRDRVQHLLWVELVHPVEILDMLWMEYPKRTLKELYSCIDNVLRLFPITHWKRIRQALSIRVSDHDLDHRGDMRWPVLSANFKHERKELRERYLELSRFA